MGQSVSGKIGFTRKGVILLVALLQWALLSSVQAAGLSPASKCNPLAQDTCGLPFPSDVFRNTVGRYNFADSILDRSDGR